MVGFFRRHIQGFSNITAALTALLKKNVKIVWGTKEEKSFLLLKKALVNAATLSFPDDQYPYKLYTDASDVACGYCLTQDYGVVIGEKPVGFYSRKFSKKELVYPTVEKELCAVVFAFNKLRKFLMGRRFELLTNNNAVMWLLKKSECSSRLQRWTVCLQEFDFSVKHIAGKLNTVADTLSRKLIDGDVVGTEGTKTIGEMAEELYGDVRLVQEVEQWYEDKYRKYMIIWLVTRSVMKLSLSR